MHLFFMALMFLPLIEIIGFVMIGGEIGVFMTLLWLVGSTMLGLWLLQGRGRNTWNRVQETPEDEFFVIQDMFDGLCLFVAGLLLVFPGFISDFLAVPLVIAPLRHWIFARLRENPDGFIRRHARSRSGTGSSTQRRTTTIIEGEYTTTAETDGNPLPPKE